MVGKPALSAGSPFALGFIAPLESQYPLPLAPTETARVSVALRAPGTPGDHTDVLVWDTDLATDPKTTVTAKLVADGGAIAPRMVLFEDQPVRLASAPKTIRLQNCGSAALVLGALTIDPADEFRSTTTLPPQLAPLETATIQVDFTPRVAGPRTATLTIASSMGPLDAQLSGTGVGSTLGEADPESLYACSCKSGDPGGMFVIAVALGLLVMRPRRRLRYPSRRCPGGGDIGD